MGKKAKKAKRAAAAPKPKASALYGVVHELASLKAVLSNVLAAINKMNDSIIAQHKAIASVDTRLVTVVFRELDAVRIGQSALDDAIATFITNQPAWDNDLLHGLQEMVAEHRRTRREG